MDYLLIAMGLAAVLIVIWQEEVEEDVWGKF
jgi:hypothetical protein